jgi:hypothetical protein
LEGPSAIQGVVIIAPVVNHDRPRIKVKLTSHLDVRNISFRDDGKRREVAIVIQKKMKLDGSFGAPKLGPIKYSQAQINGGRIHADQFVFKPELSLPNNLDTASFKELKENLLIELPWTVLIGISQGGMARSSNAQMFQLTLAASKASGNLTEGMGAAQLAKQHGHKLAPTSESFGMTFCLSDRDQVLKFRTRKQL